MTQARPSTRGTILLVEDNPLVMESTSLLLEALGYRVLTATDGAGAIRLLDEGERIDLLLTDVVIPGGMNGQELADEVRRRDAAVKVLLISAYAQEDLIAAKTIAGDLPLLSKPYRRRDLDERIHDLLSDADPG